jgi:hypothetical protein
MVRIEQSRTTVLRRASRCFGAYACSSLLATATPVKEVTAAVTASMEQPSPSSQRCLQDFRIERIELGAWGSLNQISPWGNTTDRSTVAFGDNQKSGMRLFYPVGTGETIRKNLSPWVFTNLFQTYR